MNVNCHMSELGFSIHSALVSKTQTLRIFLHKETARQGSFLFRQHQSALSFFQDMCPEPYCGELHLQSRWRSRLGARLAEARASSAHSRLASIPTFQLPFLWIQEVPPPTSPPQLHLGKIWKERVLPLSSGRGDGTQGGGLRDKQELSSQQLTFSLHLLGLWALEAPSDLPGAWSPVSEPPLWGTVSHSWPLARIFWEI